MRHKSGKSKLALPEGTRLHQQRNMSLGRDAARLAQRTAANREGNLQGFGGSADINKEEKDGFRPDYHHYEHVQFVVRS
jgi:hypothetical protein